MSLFGDFFDFDGDGTSSVLEELLGLDLLGFFEDDDSDDDSGDFDDEFDDENDEDESSDLFDSFDE